MKRYPVPFGAVTLMLAGLVSWLAGRGDIANWMLLAVALLGGIPLLWESLQQLFHRELGSMSLPSWRLVGRSSCRSTWPGAGNDVEVAVANRTFMQHLGITVPASLLTERERRVKSGQICSFLAVEKRVEGLLVLEDVPRAEL